jgi:methylase of polypeptide subunit release factors
MKDRFSHQAKEYAYFRPTYPHALFEFLLEKLVDRSTAWDAGCGNGQVASVLAEHFKTVYATDVSAAQLQACHTQV